MIKLIVIIVEFLSKLFDFEIAKQNKKERETDAKDAQEQRDEIEANPADSFIEHFGMSKEQSNSDSSTSSSDEASVTKRGS